MRSARSRDKSAESWREVLSYDKEVSGPLIGSAIKM